MPTHAELRRRAREINSLLKPLSIVGGEFARRGADGDGGYVIVDDLRPSQPIYSLGIGNDVSFDLDFAERGHTIFMYDHTVDGPPVDHTNFRFKKQAIDTGAGSLESIIAANSHQGRGDLFLKMDIEHAEYEVIPQTPMKVLEQFKQIVMELHWVSHIANDDSYPAICATLEKLRVSHEIVHLHSNNYGWSEKVGGVTVLGAVEATLVRKSDYDFKTCLKSFPTKYDRPNNPLVQDIRIGRVGLPQLLGGY